MAERKNALKNQSQLKDERGVYLNPSQERGLATVMSRLIRQGMDYEEAHQKAIERVVDADTIISGGMTKFEQLTRGGRRG